MLRAGGKKREFLFEFWQRQFGAKVQNRNEGWSAYNDLLEIVQPCGDEAVQEFQKRFGSMLHDDVQRAIAEMFIDRLKK